MITQEHVKNLLTYEPESGSLIRRVDYGNYSRWKKGTIVGTKDKDGYIVTHFMGESKKVHHLVWLYHHGYLPKMLDHINRCPWDNRIENLRLTNKRENAINSKIQKNNTSGTKGVSWCKNTGKWEVYITLKRKKIGLGHFREIKDAIAARKSAEDKMWEYAELL